MKRVQENEVNSFLLSMDLVTPSHSQGHWKWYKMVEVYGNYKHGRCEKKLLKSLHAMHIVLHFFSHVKCMYEQPWAGQQTKHNWLHNPYSIYMDQYTL